MSYCQSCNCNPCQCSCSCDPANESLASAFDNFNAVLIGDITKTCFNGQVVWSLPCGLDGAFTAFPRGAGETLLCYWQRAIAAALAGTGITFPISVVHGGTGATDATGARINLGLQIGVDVEAWSANLDSWSAIAPSAKQDACANLANWCLKAVPSGVVVGDTDTQTLTNKTVTNPDNTAQTLVDNVGGNVSWDMDAGGIATLTMAGAGTRQISNPTNLKVGTYILHLIQTPGGDTVTWDTAFQWAGGTAPTLSAGAGAHDVVSFVSDGVNLYGAALLNVS